jgi:predicted AAA+ superfamily ATPase
MQSNSYKYIPRITEDYLAKDLSSGKVIVLLGPRQSGKTTLVRHLLEGRKAFFLNFDIDSEKQRFLAASALDPDSAMTAFGNPEFLVVDEAQRLPESLRIVKGWHDSGVRPVILLLGSSAVEISGRAAESLAGRNIKRILPPLIFREIVRSRSWAAGFDEETIRSQFVPQIGSLLLSCLAFGHYPESVLTPDKRPYLLNLSSDVLWKDLLHLGLVKTPDSIRRLLSLLAHQIGSEASINELSSATGLARNTVEKYLGILEQAFIVFRLPAFSSNPRKEISKSRKIFFWDTGIRNALLNEFSEDEMRPDIGPLWENWVVAEFAKQNLLSGQMKNLYFWRSHAGSEVDLVVRRDDRLWAYEIKWNPRRQPGRAFTDKYGVPVTVIHRSEPLFNIEEQSVRREA